MTINKCPCTQDCAFRSQGCRATCQEFQAYEKRGLRATQNATGRGALRNSCPSSTAQVIAGWLITIIK